MEVLTEREALEQIGANIRYLRKAKQLTQSQLASSAGITESMLSKIESGANFELATLLKICHALKVNPAITVILKGKLAFKHKKP